MRIIIAGLAGLAGLAWAPIAHADVTRCAGGVADVTVTDTDLNLQGDTGWFPSGADVQLKLTGEIIGKTTVAMGLAPTACWDGGMSVTMPGRKLDGMLDIDYGADLHLYGQINTSVFGQSINWSGEIPIPYIPTDIALAGTSTFDPALLPDSTVTSASVTDKTNPITVLSSNVLGDLIDVTGISGGLAVTVTGQMTSTYATSALTVNGTAITSATGSAAVAMPDTGYGSNVAVAISATGNIHYAPSLVFAVSFNAKVLGISIVNFTIASVTMPLPATDRPVTLTAAAANIGLPLLAPPATTTLGFATGSTQTLTLHNNGAAPLMIEFTSGPDGVNVDPVTIDAGSDGAVVVEASNPDTVDMAPLVLATNDPNTPSLTVTLDPAMTNGSAGGSGSAGTPDGSAGGGCDAGGGAGSASVFVGFALVALLRRRRS